MKIDPVAVVRAAFRPRVAARWLLQQRAVRRRGEQLLDHAQRLLKLPVRLTVVVPVYNVEEYLADCLSSIFRSSYPFLRVIAVDDGSTDGSAEILRDFQRRYRHRMQIITQPNAGLGAARNAALPHVKSTYLAFADSDDVVPRWGYRRMIDTLDQTRSDFVVGALNRLHGKALTVPKWVRELHGTDRLSTTIAEFPDMVYDCFAHNKVYRLDFFRRSGLHFTEGVRYEDQIPSVQAYLAARTFDVLSDFTYFWRIRESGTSITQSVGELDNLRDRLQVQRQVKAILTDGGHDELRRIWLSRRVLGNDITLYTRDVDLVDDEFYRLLREWITTLIGEDDWTRLDAANPPKRVLGWLVAHGTRRQVEDFVTFERQNPGGYPTQFVDGAVVAELPYRGDPAVGVPDELYRVGPGQLTLQSSLRMMTWLDERRLQIQAWAYINLLDLRQVHAITTVLVSNVATGEVREYPTTPRTDLAVTDRTKNSHLPYDLGGFQTTIDTADLRRPDDGGRGDIVQAGQLPASWRVTVRVEAGGIIRQGRLAPAQTYGAVRSPSSSAGVDGVVVTPVWDNGVLHLTINPKPLTATDVTLDGRVLRLRGTVPPGVGRTASTVTATCEYRGAQYRAQGPLTVEDDGAFAAELAVPELPNPPRFVDWRIRAVLDGSEVYVHWQTPSNRTHPDPTSGLAVRRTLRGNVALEERARFIEIGDVAVTDDEIVVTGQYIGVQLTGLTLKGKRVELAADRFIVTGQEFQASFARRRSEWSTLPLPLPCGVYLVQAAYRTPTQDPDARDRRRTLRADRALVDRIPFEDAEHDVRVGLDPRSKLWVELKPQLPQGTESPYHQGRLQRDVYAPARRGARDRAVLFEAFKGQYAACNPLAICRELQHRGTDLRLYWSVTDLSVPVPEGTEPLVRLSEQWYRALGSSKYLVNNNNWPKLFSKADEQIYLQTWHGTPLKRIGHDIHRILFSYRNYLDTMDREAARWDYLISPNAFSTEIFPRAFAYPGPMLQTGYPRNDVLVAAPPEPAARVRARYGIDPNRKILLYAPTWRDDQYDGRPGLYNMVVYLNLKRVAEALGEDYVVLVRGHSNTLAHGKTVGTDSVVDATRYPDINDLYLAADLLVTDYSSVMFDYAVTGKPMLFLTPDFDDYRDRVRGFYFDFEQLAPGPLMRTTDEVIDAVRDLPSVVGAYRDRYRAFSERFVSLEDGGAAARVVAEVFGSRGDAG